MLEECVDYFKANDLFHRAFVEMKKKWKKHGRVTGNIIIEGATSDERATLQLFLGRRFETRIIKFRMTDFEDALNKTMFKDIQMLDLLEAYFSEKLITNKIETERRVENKRKFFDDVIEKLKEMQEYTHTVAMWVENIWERKSLGYLLILTENEKDKLEAESILIYVCKALNYINKAPNTRLAEISNAVAGDQHYFDKENSSGRLLLYALSFVHNCEFPKEAEKIVELYYISGIKPDGHSSYTMAYGISLYTKDGIHQAYEGYRQQNEEFIITLPNLTKIVKADCKNKKVFVVENKLVFSKLCEDISAEDTAIICTSSQMKTCTLLLIDLLCSAGCNLYFSTNIDPEGIMLADSIIKRSKGQAVPWCFEVEDYEASISKKRLSDTSIRKLKNIENEVLKKVSEVVKKNRKSGCQEYIIDKMRKDILTSFNR